MSGLVLSVDKCGSLVSPKNVANRKAGFMFVVIYFGFQGIYVGSASCEIENVVVKHHSLVTPKKITIEVG